MAKTDTIELIKKARHGDDHAKELVVSQNLGLVWSIVHRFKNNYYDKEDLFQIGCIGLMKAVNNFDTNYGVQFSTYAVPIIMGEIKRYFRDDGTIKVSRSLKELNLKINKARELLINQNGYEPTVETIAKYLEVDVQDVVEAIDSSYYPTSLSEPIYEKDGSSISMEERVEDKHNKMWFEKIALKMEIDKLDEKEKQIHSLQKALKEYTDMPDDLACGGDYYKIVGMKEVYNGTDGYGHKKYKDEQRVKEMTWDAIFSAFAPYLFSYVNYESFSSALKKGINSVIDNESFFGSINEDCIQTIKIQLNALGLIEVSPKKSTGMGVIEFIKLTEKGKTYLLKLKSVKKG